MTTHIVTSHGGDFFGEDRHPRKTLAALGEALHWMYLYRTDDAAKQLVEALGAAATMTAPVTVPPGCAPLLLKAAADTHLPRRLAGTARLLADAAGRAAVDGDPWTWTPTTDDDLEEAA